MPISLKLDPWIEFQMFVVFQLAISCALARMLVSHAPGAVMERRIVLTTLMSQAAIAILASPGSFRYI